MTVVLESKILKTRISVYHIIEEFRILKPAAATGAQNDTKVSHLSLQSECVRDLVQRD